MNYRYIIKTLNARKIIELLMLKKLASDMIPTLNVKESKSLIHKLSTIEENALFYQVSRTLYELENNTSGFFDDRKLYKENHILSIIKTNDLLKNIIFYLDFTGVFTIKNHIKKISYHRIAELIFSHGLILKFEEQNTIHILPFLKSGSMGRRSTISFIRADLKPKLDERLNFDMIHEDQKYSISKLQAYQGLYLSSGIRVELDDLNDETVVVVRDYNKTSRTDSYTTALSRNLLKELLFEMFFTNEDSYRENKIQINTAILNNSKIVSEFRIEEFNQNNDDLKDAISYYLNTYPDEHKDPLNSLDPEIINEYNSIFNLIVKFLGLDRLKNDDELSIFEDVYVETISNMFDGEGFIDKDYLEHINKNHLSINDDNYHYSVQFRLPFVKGVLHAVDFQKWCLDGNITHIFDAFGNYREISKIKIVLTKSQFKCYDWIQSRFNNDYKNSLQPMQKYFEYFKTYQHSMYITNLDQLENQKFETILNYQVLHTPALKLFDFNKLLKRGNKNYVDLVSNSSEQIDYFMDSVRYYDPDKEYQVDLSEHDLLIELLKTNIDFIHDELFQNRLKSYLESLLKNMKTGRIQIEGTVRILSGDLLELLQHITGEVLYRSGFGRLLDRFYAPSQYTYLSEDKYYSILRNPHITSKELVCAKPIKKEQNTLREEYFAHLTGVVMLNTYSNQMLAMQTADTDGDIVRIISNDIYTQSALKSQDYDNKKLLFFPSLKGAKTYPTKEMLFDATKKSFSTRIGLMSNHAFSHSILAYNENDSNLKSKEFHKKIAEKMSFVIALEIDAVKSGKAPYYIPPVFSNPFIDYKSKVELKRKENVNFYLKDTSPNLYYLKSNAELVLLEAEAKKKLNPNNHRNIIRFKFETDSNWHQKLNMDLLKEIYKIMIAYLDWNKRLSFIIQPKTYFDNKIQSTLQYILSLQYDDIEMLLVLDGLLVKLQDIHLEKLIDIRDESLKDNWHLVVEHRKKEALLSKYFDELFNDEENALLMNFNHSGHKILYLALSESILSLENIQSNDLKDHDTLSKNKSLFESIFNRHGIKINLSIKQFMTDAFEEEMSVGKLMKIYVDNTVIKESSDYEKAKSYVKKIVASTKRVKHEQIRFSLENLEEISKIYADCHDLMYDKSYQLLPIWNIRFHVERYIEDKLNTVFRTNHVSRSDETMYYYALRTYDSSMRFMFTFAKGTMLAHVYENSLGGIKSYVE